MKKSAQIPVYSIDTFKHTFDHPHCQVEVFTKNRNFNVSYPHRHDFYEILFITRGTGTYTIDFNEYNISADTIFFVSPGQVHTISYSDDTAGFIFLFTAEFYLLNKQDQQKLSSFSFFDHFSGNTPPLQIQSAADVQLLMNLWARACNEQAQTDADAEEMVRAILDIILIYCKRNYKHSQSSEKQPKGRQLVQKLNRLIEEYYLKNYSVKDYADILHITPSHLNETVKKNTGQTASDIIDMKMILEIKRMLIHTDLNVNELAARFNFSDQSYFSKFFKNKEGMTPFQFRKSIKS